MTAAQIISAHPAANRDFTALLGEAIDACLACAQTCASCADACTAEQDVTNLRQCIRVTLDCANLCLAAAAIASRWTEGHEEVLLGALESCELACREATAECERHGSTHEHCRLCAEECRHCQHACRLAAQDIGGASGRIQTN